jgi:hypothetical protein
MTDPGIPMTPPPEGPPPARRRPRGLIIGLVVGLVAVAAGAGGYFLFLRDGGAKTPEEALQGFYAAVAAGDCERAATFVDPSFVTQADLCKDLDGVKAEAGTLGAVKSVDDQGDVAYVVASRTVKGLTDQRIITVNKGPEGWAVAGGAACYGEEQPADLGNTHLGSGETFQGYNSVPPTSGPHDPNPAEMGTIFRSPQPNEKLVHSMEHGAVIFWTNLPDKLAKHAEETVLDVYDQGYESLILTPDPDMEYAFAMTAWGTLQQCVGIDGEEIQRFVDAHYGSGAEGLLACLGSGAPSCKGL